VTPLERFRALLRIPTISRLDPDDVDWPQFDRFVQSVDELYPAIHARLTREIVADHSMLFRWAGASAEHPTVLMAHYDVVAATNERWEHPPFDAELTGEGDAELLWARGTLDNKGTAVAILEAVESSVGAGTVPANDIYLCFSHDEETMGHGAEAIVELLESRGIHPALVLDEGGAVVEGIFPGVSRPIAVVGVSEKGIMTVELRVVQNGGHASTPPRLPATVRLARAISRLNAKPFRAAFTPTNLEMLGIVGAHARQPYRWVFTNLWLTRLPLRLLFARLSDETNAMIRTTAVATQLSGSQAANALAESASAVVNVRVAAGSSARAAIDHLRAAVRDAAVEIDVLQSSEPSPTSPTSGPQWNIMRETIGAAYPSAIATPYVMLGATDSRHFTRICDAVYRFSPFEMSTEERGTLHAINERIHVSTWLRGIEFFRDLIGRL
jgi:carboxypeptidase PM20D1